MGERHFPVEQLQQIYANCHERLVETTNQLATLISKQADLVHAMWKREAMIMMNQKRWKDFTTAPQKVEKFIILLFDPHRRQIWL